MYSLALFCFRLDGRPNSVIFSKTRLLDLGPPEAKHRSKMNEDKMKTKAN